MKTKIILLFCLSSLLCFIQAQQTVIPYPNSIEVKDGQFEFKRVLLVDVDTCFKSEIELLSSVFRDEYGIKLILSSKGTLLIKKNDQLSENVYKLQANKKGILIEASTKKSCFYALQTLRQLVKLNGRGWYQIHSCDIIDSPKYSWRAFMLDESRYFKGTVFVKNMLDQMALLKMNVFHWHLTDDQGWRIEIEKYPLLTEIGAWRDSTQIAKVSQGMPAKFYPYAHGGFYTKDEIRDIIDYAAKRHIMIVPEIEMPGHASAAVAAYPWLSPTGEKIAVPGGIGGIYNSTYNVADDKVYTFLTDVLGEVIDLFPSKIVHIGGDEVKFDTWNSNKKIKALMMKEKLTNASDVQVFFVNKISNFIASKQCRMIGWNDIMGKNLHAWSTEANANQKLASGTIVHFWKGEASLLKEALADGYEVVNSNHWDTYLDYTYNRLPLEKSYNFSPIPNDVNPIHAKQILGLGCQMWSETIPKVCDAYRQIFPRIAAYAEVGWTASENKNFNRFSQNLLPLKRYWDSKGISYFEE